MMARVKPPRAAFLDFPLGRQCGKPGDVDLQTKILKHTLSLFGSASIPGEIVDLPYEWGASFDWETYMCGLDGMLKMEGAVPQEWAPKK